MMRDGVLSRVVSIISSIFFAWSLCLLLTVLRIIIPESVLTVLSPYVPFIRSILQNCKQLRRTIMLQCFSLRCITVTEEATEVFFLWIKEIMIIVLVAHWDSIMLEQLSDVLEDYRLAWILKPICFFAGITKRYLHLFPGINDEVGGEEEFDEQEEDETEPPSLIVDPRYLQLLEIQKASPMVFDSTFGLIPEEVRSRWAQESQERDLLRKQVQQLRESKKLPPVRNWDYVPDPSTSPTLSVPVPLDPSRGSKKLSLNVTCSMATHNDEDHDEHVMINQAENIAAHAASPFLPGAPLWDD